MCPLGWVLQESGDESIWDAWRAASVASAGLTVPDREIGVSTGIDGWLDPLDQAAQLVEVHQRQVIFRGRFFAIQVVPGA